MDYLLDTSAFIVGFHKTLDHVYTIFPVIDELDGLKEIPRTRVR